MHSGKTLRLRCIFCLTLTSVELERKKGEGRCDHCSKPFLLDRPIKIIQDDFNETVVNSEIPVLVDFYADWCGPCKMIAPVVEELADEYEGKFGFAKVDVDANPQTAMQFGIRSIPALLLFKDGKVAEEVIGAVPKAVLKKKIDKVLEES